MRFHRILAAAALMLTGIVTTAEATPITYTLTATTNGTLAGHLFSNALLTWTITGDTADAVPGPGSTVGIPALTDIIALSGLGTGTLVSPYEAATNFDPQAVVFAQTDFSHGISFTAPAFAAYDIRSLIGPLPVTVTFASVLSTSLGTLVFDSASDATFQAAAPVVPVPEPSTLAIFGAGLLAVGATHRRRKPKQA